MGKTEEGMKKITFFAVLVMLALLVAGCGGQGSSATPTPPIQPPPLEEPAVQPESSGLEGLPEG